jgi:hypothetical protein
MSGMRGRRLCKRLLGKKVERRREAELPRKKSTSGFLGHLI